MEGKVSMNEEDLKCIICGLQMIEIPRDDIQEGFHHYECPDHDNVMSTFQEDMVELAI